MTRKFCNACGYEIKPDSLWVHRKGTEDLGWRVEVSTKQVNPPPGLGSRDTIDVCLDCLLVSLVAWADQTNAYARIYRRKAKR